MIPEGRIPANGTGFAMDEGKDEDELAQVLDAYLAEVEAGRPVDPEEWVGRHPAIAGRLRACLKGLHMVEAAAEALDITPGPADFPDDDFDTDTEPEPGAEADSSGRDSRGARLGDFRVIRELGRGGMGVVYEAEQHSLGRRVALKVLPFAAAIDPRQIARFRVEAQAASHLNHPHIVPVYSVGCQRGVHYYAMQLIDGPTLAERIDELRNPGGGEATAQVVSTLVLPTSDETPVPTPTPMPAPERHPADGHELVESVPEHRTAPKGRASTATYPPSSTSGRTGKPSSGRPPGWASRPPRPWSTPTSRGCSIATSSRRT